MYIRTKGDDPDAGPPPFHNQKESEDIDMFSQESVKVSPGACTAYAVCRSAAHARELCSGFTGPVRQISMFADLYCEQERLILEAPNEETLLKLMHILNHSVEEF